jgi:glycosyltransferase involved in cell wall biosynthesis
MRRIDCAAAQRPDLLFVNSKEVQHRVKKYYGRSSTILYPPVRSITVRGKRTARYYVAHGRLVRQKRIDFIVRACRVAQLPLKVIGEGYLKKDLQRKAGPNIEFLGFVTDAQLASIYRNAKALMYAAEDEDFGIVPVEAQSAGVPVLAFRSGGVLETVREGITGYFFSRISQRAVMNTVLRLEQFPLSSHACVVNARQFSAQQFARTFKKHIRLLQKPS